MDQMYKSIKLIIGTVFALVLMIHTVSAQSLLEEASFRESGIKRLEINSSFIEVDYQGGMGEELTFAGKIFGKSKDQNPYKIRYERLGETMKVWIEVLENNKSWFMNNALEGAFIFTGPSDLAIDLKISSGNAFVRNVNHDSLSFRASSGSISLQDVQGHIYAATTSGMLKLQNIKGDISGKVTSGSLKMNNITGNQMDISSSSGSIELVEINMQSVSLSTTSGSISMTDVAGLSRAKSSSGSIKGKNVLASETLNLNTSSGSIAIDFNNKLNEGKVSLAASSGSLSINGNKSSKKLEMGQGNSFRINGRSSSGSQKLTFR